MSPSTSSTHQDEDENLSVFSAVNATINFEAVPDLASSIRLERDRKTKVLAILDKAPPGAEYTKCTVSPKPLFGSYNILYAIEFADGLRWLLKIPAVGYHGRWTESDARAITSEALTMQLVKRKTTIPVPEVFLYQSTLENELNCPFILMEFIEGVSLHDFWFDNSHSPTEIEQRRTQILEKVASAIIQLNQFRFSEGGSILFDDGGNPGIGPMRCVDQQAMLDRLQTDDEDETSIMFEVGPFKSQKDYFHCMLDRRETPPDKFSRGFHKLLRLFLAWMPYTDNATKPSFVLAHPDFDIQNIIVSPEGELRGIIDWDGVTAVPSCFGNESYPSWLTRDWDPMMYGYRPPASSEGQEVQEVQEIEQPKNKEDAGWEATCEPQAKSENVKESSMYAQDLPEYREPAQKGNEDDKNQGKAEITQEPGATEVIKENSPEELSRYREIYQGFIAVLATQAYEKASNSQANEAIEVLRPEACVRLTRNSLMIENLSIAASNPMCQDGILEKIFDEIARIDEDKYNDFAEGGEESEMESDAESDAGAAPRGEADYHDSNRMGVRTEAVEGSDSPTDDARDSESECENASEVEESDDGTPAEYFDLGGFNFGDVALALADGELDEARLARLKAGFAALCS